MYHLSRKQQRKKRATQTTEEQMKTQEEQVPNEYRDSGKVSGLGTFDEQEAYGRMAEMACMKCGKVIKN